MNTPRSGARPTDAHAPEADTLGGPKTQVSAELGADTLSVARGEMPQPPVVSRGSTLGRYVVLDRLGSGGMGVVFSAYDPELDRKVAIKVLQASLAQWSKATAGRTRLLREAQAMAKLSHPNVIAVYDVGTINDDVFLAMEFIAGSTLRDWTKRQREIGTFDWRETLRLFIEAGHGLAAAHRAGIVHRDFKPENVMVDEQTRARVLDFGLARPSRESTSSSEEVRPEQSFPQLRLTATGAVMGTPFYMAPEQHRGSIVDERADQFAFCVAVWEALYDERPYQGATLAELAGAVLSGRLTEPPRAARVPLRVRRALERGLATDPDARHASMDDLLAELGREPASRRRLVVLGAGFVAVPTAAVVAVLFVGREDPPCLEAAAALGDTWAAEPRERVRRAFAPHVDADGEQTFERVAGSIDAYVRAWSEARTRACEDTRVRSEQSERVLELRYSCLDGRKYRLEAVLDVLFTADKDIVYRAPALVDQLPSIPDCLDVARVRSFTPIPSDSEVAAAVQQVRRRLARVDALVAGGQLEDVHGALDAVEAEAEATHHRPVLAEVLSVRARVAMFEGDVAAADRYYERAQLLAEAEGYDGAILDTHLWMATLEGTRNNDFEQANRHLRSAAAVLERMGTPPSSKASLLLVTARVHSVQGEEEQSAEAYAQYLEIMREQGRESDSLYLAAAGAYGNILARLERVTEADAVITDTLARARTVLGGRHPEVANLLIYKARVLKQQTRYEEALARFDEAQSILAGAFGPMHSNLGAMLNDKAIVLTYLGRYQDAFETFGEAAPVVLRTYGEENVQYAVLLVNAGETLVELGRAEEAVVVLERAAEIRGRLYGREDVNYAYALADLGLARLESGKPGPARVALEEALRLITAALGEDDADRTNALVGLGELELLEGRPAVAEQRFAEVISIYERTGNEKYGLVGRARFGLARVRAAEGSDEEALALARTARAELAKYAWTVRHVRAIDRWLAER